MLDPLMVLLCPLDSEWDAMNKHRDGLLKLLVVLAFFVNYKAVLCFVGVHPPVVWASDCDLHAESV